jgi:HSP20 family protein
MPSAILDKDQKTSEVVRRRSLTPPISIYENATSYIVLLAMPGADEKSIRINVQNERLIVEANLKGSPDQNAQEKYCEMRLGDYRRELEVGDSIDVDKVEATVTSGLLKLVMPKSKHSKSRKIEIKSV